MTLFPAEPILFQYICKEKIWGGTALQEKMGKTIPPNTLVGECWELSALENDQTIINNGAFKNKPFGEIYSGFKQEIIGTQNYDTFPLLLKILDSKDLLSVQVHPNNNQALQYGVGQYGKTECWYVIDAQKGAELITGFKHDVTATEIKNAVENGKLETLLNTVQVEPGQVYLIPSGTVHAIMGNTLLYEIQQASDATFRLFDWNRLDNMAKPRELHLKEALNVSDKKAYPTYLIDPIVCDNNVCEHSYRAVCRYFSLEQYRFHAQASISLPSRSSCQILTVISGNVKLCYPAGELELSCCETTLVPYLLQNVTLKASKNTNILISTIPNIPEEIIKPLLNKGYDISKICQLGGLTNKNDLYQFSV